MLVHEYDDERTLEEEESLDGGRNFSSEIADLEKEGNMPLEELLAIYRYEGSAGSSIDSSSGDLTDELPDMTLDKEEIAKDLLSGDYEEETQSSADDLTPSVTSHEATDFFPRTLRSNTISDGDKESECDDDGPSPEDSRKEIMVGTQYQADVPSCLCHYKDGEKVYEDEDELLWSPGTLPENKVRSFLSEVLSRTTDEKTGCDKPGMHVRDNEQALHELVKCNYNTREALERYCSRIKSSKEKSPQWSEEECKNFEHALQMYDKNFHLIQKHKVTTRTVAECVAFYYMWKKSERFDFFVQQNRFGKKKYSSYPGVTDLMDRLVDEAEGLAVDSSSSVCSGAGGGGRLETTTDQQLSLLNSITASDLTALSNSVATVCSPAEVSCLDSYSFPPLESLHRGSLNHEESLGFPSNGADPDCLNMLDAGFYHSDLGQLGGVCVNKDCERPSKRLKMALPDSFINDVSVGNLGVDFEARRKTTHHHRITGAKMAVSVTDFGSLAGSGEPNGFLGGHARHHTQHTAALQSE
ncbi:mesoderm induction early response protein 3 isoform X2 [Thunnus albacares]|nr:mesoderm induction early response protein 3 isoform X3 [Thunnus maccoyii]XP_042277392.1 mesoderm induction early response protein 3 isoform X3 [Thunnus maccoyii]XP_042277393.1 mesoderm induction early response protein 3 isoform X3 [Thunnus maccoyii]XP_044229941.1 mesoderm induction early response protein 3 isoform X2 [Thunnus albacares]XP_044229950.1 mesoderm induction early response protein 3 isoform X2 [Thunnus albacares]